MLTTNTIKVKERSQENEKLTIISSNKVKPKGFKMKGKRTGPQNRDLITTGNVDKFLEKRKKEVVIEQAAAKIRKAKLDEDIAKLREIK